MGNEHSGGNIDISSADTHESLPEAGSKRHREDGEGVSWLTAAVDCLRTSFSRRRHMP